MFCLLNQHSTKNLVPKVFWITKKFGSRKIWVGSLKIWSKNFGPKKIKGSQNIGFKHLVEIGSVISEIFLIWKNVARTLLGLMLPGQMSPGQMSP